MARPITTRVGILGGSGFYQMEGAAVLGQVRPNTPFGEPSDAITLVDLDGVPTAFLPRHGVGHRISPSEINVRANLFALKALGVEWLISISAVGSLREDIKPRDLVVLDQLYDHTRHRPTTFFDDGIVVHVSLADPFCAVLREVLLDAARGAGATVHRGGSYICMEGPQFSTRLESETYRRWGFDLIGMTTGPEAKLAMEAEMSYAVLACVTDYDCWHPHHDDVTVAMLLETLRANVELAKDVVRRAVAKLPATRENCPSVVALDTAIVTDRAAIPDEVKERLRPLLSRALDLEGGG